jgi:hypothetical protein
VELVQFMGKDNVPFHTVIFPATLLGTQEPWTMMRSISVTEYLNYEDGKFSKSRGVGVFGNDAKDTGIPVEVSRLFRFRLRLSACAAASAASFVAGFLPLLPLSPFFFMPVICLCSARHVLCLFGWGGNGSGGRWAPWLGGERRHLPAAPPLLPGQGLQPTQHPAPLLFRRERRSGATTCWQCAQSPRTPVSCSRPLDGGLPCRPALADSFRGWSWHPACVPAPPMGTCNTSLAAASRSQQCAPAQL